MNCYTLHIPNDRNFKILLNGEVVVSGKSGDVTKIELKVYNDDQKSLQYPGS